jgi:hypothetical protein
MQRRRDYNAYRNAVLCILRFRSLSEIKIYSSALCCDTLNLWPSLGMRDQVFHRYKSTSKVEDLNI